MIRLRMLGASEIRIGRKVITPAAEVVFALGVYLCVRAGERLTREEVTETLWGEGRESQGRHSLRQMLYRLRQKGFTLDEDGEELYLDPARVESDLARALGEGWPATAVAADVDAAAQLAPGFNRVITERFDEWLDGVRGRLAAQHRRACLRQIAQARREGRWADLDRWALQVLRSDPLNEEATLARAESAAISGSKAVALEIIDTYIEELGDRAPAIGLPASILRRRIAERRSDWSSRGPREVPLVGREELMARLTGYVDSAARGEGNSVLLWGAPGIGKTRLAEEVCNYAELEGFRTVRVRAAPFGGARPMALLNTVVPSLRALPGALGADPTSLSILDQMLSIEKSPTRAPAPFLNSLIEALKGALRDLLEAVLAECKILLITDDLHNADTSSVEVLQHVAMQLRSVRFVHIGTARGRPTDIGLPDQSAQAVYVPPLQDQEARRLATLSAPERTIEQTGRIVRAAGGNPLFLRELTSHTAWHEGRPSLPHSLHELISARLSALTPHATRALQVVALLGGQATIPRVRQLLSINPDLVELLDGLETQGIIRLASVGTIEIHECWYQVIVSEMGRLASATIAHECASLLLAESPRQMENVWRAALLLSDIGEDRAAVEQFIVCGEDLLMRGLPREALGIVGRALPIVTSRSAHVALLSIRARACHTLGHMAEALTACKQGLELCRESPDEVLDQYALLLGICLEMLQRMGRSNEKELSELAVLLESAHVSPATLQYGCLQAVAAEYNHWTPQQPDRFLELSRRNSAAQPPMMSACLVELICASERGDTNEIARIERQCAEAEMQSMPVGLRTRSLYIRSVAQRLARNHDIATDLGERSLALSSSYGLINDSMRVMDLMIFMRLDQELPEDAEDWISRRDTLLGATVWPEGMRARTHALARARMLRGDFKSAIELYEPMLGEIDADPSALRRCIDHAALAHCYAMCDDAGESRRRSQSLLSTLTTVRAGHQADYVVNSTLLAMRQLGDAAEFNALGTAYARQRVRQFNVQPLPSYRALAEFAS